MQYPKPQVISEPLYEPISLQEAKGSCRVTNDLEDDWFEDAIPAAREAIEGATGRSGVLQDLRISLNSCPRGNRIELPRSTPLISINEVRLVDDNGEYSVWSSTNYIADNLKEPGGLVLKPNVGWPSLSNWPVAPMRIDYTAGPTYYPINAVNKRFKKAMKMVIGTMYINRESEVMVEKIAAQTVTLKFFRNLLSGLRVVHEYSEI